MRAHLAPPSSFGANVAARLHSAPVGHSLRVDGKDVTFERCSQTTLIARDASGGLVLFNLERLYAVIISETTDA